MCVVFYLYEVTLRKYFSLVLYFFFLSFLSNKACMIDDVCQGGLPDVCSEEGYECNIECCSTDLCNGAVEAGGDGEGRTNLQHTFIYFR